MGAWQKAKSAAQRSCWQPPHPGHPSPPPDCGTSKTGSSSYPQQLTPGLTPESCVSSLGGRTPRRTESRDWKPCLHTRVHSSAAPSSREVGAARVRGRMDRQMNKMWSMQSCSGLRSGLERKDTLTPATPHGNLEDTTLGGVWQTAQGSTYMRSRESDSQTQEAECWCQGLGQGEGREPSVHGTEFQSGRMKSSADDSGDGPTTVRTHSMPRSWSLNSE